MTWDCTKWATKEDPARQSDFGNLIGPYGCPRKFKYTKDGVDRDPFSVPWRRTMGTAVHHAIEVTLKSGHPPTHEEYTYMVLEGLEAERGNKPIDWKDARAELEVDKGARMAAAVVDDMAERAEEIVLTESSFTTCIGGFWFRGTLDILYRDRGGRLVLADWKTGAKAISKIVRDHGYQLGIYAHAVAFGEFEDGKRVSAHPDKMYIVQTQDMLAYTKGSRKKIWTQEEAEHWGVPMGGVAYPKPGDQKGPAWYEGQFSLERLKRLELSCSRMVQMVRNGHFPDSMSEKCGGCGFRPQCFTEGLSMGGDEQDRANDSLEGIDLSGLDDI